VEIYLVGENYPLNLPNFSQFISSLFEEIVGVIDPVEELGEIFPPFIGVAVVVLDVVPNLTVIGSIVGLICIDFSFKSSNTK
jgi:hypothetical protein